MPPAAAQHRDLAVAVAQEYGRTIDGLPPEFGHCADAARLAAALAHRMGIAAEVRDGYRRDLIGTSWHVWLDLGDGFVLHSPAIGTVEISYADLFEPHGHVCAAGRVSAA